MAVKDSHVNGTVRRLRRGVAWVRRHLYRWSLAAPQAPEPTWALNVAVATGFGFMTGVTLAVALQLSNQDLVGHYIQLVSLVGILAALALVTYLVLPDLLNALVSTLTARDVIGQARGASSFNHFAEFILRFEEKLNRRSWGVACLLLSMMYVLYRVRYAPLVASNSYESAQVWTFLTYCFEALALYLGAMSIIRTTIISLYISQLSRRFEFLVRPLHPDGCGGFRPIGHLFGRLVELTALFTLVTVGLAQATQETGGDWIRRPEWWWGLGFAYLILLPMLTIALLLVPHRAMVRARDTVVDPLSRTFEAFVEKVRPVAGDTAEQISSKNQQLSQIKLQVETLQKAYPVWPIETLRLRQVAITALLPIIIPVVTAIILRFVSGPSN